LKTFTLKDRSEVDIRVAQEIKNHQDLMYQTSQQVQALSKGLDALVMRHGEVIAKADSDRKQVLISFENLHQEVLKKLDQFFQRIGDLESKCLELQSHLDFRLDEFQEHFLTKEDHVKATYPHFAKLAVLQEEVGSNYDFFQKAVSDLKAHAADQLEGVRKDIPSVEEFKPLKKEMEDHFQAFKIDFIGLVKEIALLKKAVGYDQKKFENVYTLIERLKERVQ